MAKVELLVEELCSRLLEESPNPNTDMMKVFDQIQYAYKINANFLYGIGTNAAYRRFVNVMQTSARGPLMITAIKREYQSLRIQIRPGSALNDTYMIVRSTVMGVTSDYVNVLVGSKRLATRVLKSDYNRSTMIYNEMYYVAMLDRCMDVVLGALNVKDTSFMKTNTAAY